MYKSASNGNLKNHVKKIATHSYCNYKLCTLEMFSHIVALHYTLFLRLLLEAVKSKP